MTQEYPGAAFEEYLFFCPSAATVFACELYPSHVCGSASIRLCCEALPACLSVEAWRTLQLHVVLFFSF